MPERHSRKDLTLHRERCFLVAVITPDRLLPGEDPLDELACLIDTAGGEVVGRMIQRLQKPHPKTYLGKGKFADMVDAAIECSADTIVVDDSLSPKQLSAIEDACHRKVIDRNEVILDIFNHRARSHQAKMQVELAQLQYEMPRLIRKWTHLERLGGGLGTRGPGESQIESDRRIIRSKINQLKGELEKTEKRKEREVAARSESFSTCLVGYTNAGKSSLLNSLTNAGAFVEDRLFATLDTLTRRLEFEDGLGILISDTVGFIRRLPHHLVASFHATLEEAAQADLLLHVVDAADPMARIHIKAVNDTLAELGLADCRRLHIFNKTDAIRNPAHLEGLINIVEESLSVSAKTGDGIEQLKAHLHQLALVGHQRLILRFPSTDGRRFAAVNEAGQVQNVSYEESETVVQVLLDAHSLERIKRLPGPVEVSDG